MLFTAALSLFLGLGSSLVAASPVSSGFNATVRRRELCGTTPSQEFIAQAESHFVENRVMVDADTELSIPVHWHKIFEDDTVDGGDITLLQIETTLRALNSDYAKCRVRFWIASIDNTRNPDWFRKANPINGTNELTAMETYLKQGEANALNVYTVGFNNSDLLGYANFPWLYSSDPKGDGVVIKHSSLLGGTLDRYNLGRTLTHEVGHWGGLYHPFEGGCEGGDQVDDTPPEGEPAFGCPESKDTCPDFYGTDPIHNYMDYVDHACMKEFTYGQCTRFRDQISTYRNITGSS